MRDFLHGTGAPDQTPVDPRRPHRIAAPPPAVILAARLALAALVAAACAPIAAGAAGEPRALIARVRSLATAPTAALRAPLAARARALGLARPRSLLDGLPARPMASGTRVANPFDLDPSCVWRFEASDSAAAASAGRALAADPEIEWVALEQLREPALDPDDPWLAGDPLLADGRQWGLWNRGPGGPYGGLAGADIHALEAWGMSAGSGDLRLAVADTGIDPDHPELQMPLAGGTRIEFGLNVTADPSPSFADSFGHGTPVAGVMAARTGEGAHFDSLGVAGVCGGDGALNPGCRVVPIKIAPGHSGLASSFDIARAILYATSSGTRAMNLSFAGAGPSRLERETLYHAITHGCVVVAASGNRGASTGRAPMYPAAYAADGLCIQAGASDPWDKRAAFSSYGPGLDLVAPGVDIWTTFMTYPSAAGAWYPGYVAGSGTSFAAPFTTGALGLLAAARPELCDADFQRILRESADDVGDPGPDAETGWGRLDAAAALRAVGREFGIWHDEVAADWFADRGVDSLVVAEPGPGALAEPRGWPGARLVEARATVAIPDSFADSVRVWPRVGGTMAVRGDFRIPYFAPWAEVIARAPRAFTLRGYLYRVEGGPAGEAGLHLPLPPDQIRFGFTVIGRVARGAWAPPTSRADGPLTVAPNPCRTSVRIAAPRGADIAIYDLAGRCVRRLDSDGSVRPATWNGRDASGRSLPPGLYLVGCRGGRGGAWAKLLKLE